MYAFEISLHDPRRFLYSVYFIDLPVMILSLTKSPVSNIKMVIPRYNILILEENNGKTCDGYKDTSLPLALPSYFPLSFVSGK